MIPLHDDNPTRRRAVVTVALIAANALIFFAEPLAASNVLQAKFFYCHAAIPWEVTHHTQWAWTAARFGCPGKSIWGSILYSMFLHGSLLHIGGNMLFLWIFGNNVEDRLGRLRYLVFYFACGFAATFAQAYASADSTAPLIGASGAVAGVLGAYLVMFPRARVTTLALFFVVDLPAVVVLGGWFLLQVFSEVGSVSGGASTGVAYLAHVGGFVTGMALGPLLQARAGPSPARF